MSKNVSLAIWCVSKEGNPSGSIEAHFNYWRLAGNEGVSWRSRGVYKDVIEIGIMMKENPPIKNIKLYIPAEIKRSSVRDCAQYLSKANIAQGIFNELLRTTGGLTPGQDHVQLSYSDGREFCKVHSFAKDHEGNIDKDELSIDNNTEGSTLTINEQAVHESCGGSGNLGWVYFRIRVFLEVNSPFVQNIETPDKIFQSGFEEIEYLDFRLNEARTLPEAIERKMRSEQSSGLIRLDMVAFLTAIPVMSELASSSAAAHKLRLLEHNIWSGYIPSGIPEGMVVYHWKKKSRDGSDESIQDFTSFIKLRTRKSNYKTLGKYIVFAFAFGLLGNLVAAALVGPVGSLLSLIGSVAKDLLKLLTQVISAI